MKDEADSNPSGGILLRKTPEDQGLVKLPTVAPHLQVYQVGQHQTLLVSETFNTLLHGKLYSDLLPLMDGSNTVDEVVQATQEEHGFPNVLAALVSLSEKGYVVSANYDLDQSRAAYWSTLGASPRWAEQVLGESCVAVDGGEDALVHSLEKSGVAVGEKDPRLTVYVRPDYLGNELAEVNRRHLESQSPWMVVRPNGIEPMFGPIFDANLDGPCWSCLSYRLGSHQEVHNFLRSSGDEYRTFVPFATEQTASDSVQGLVAGEIAKWLVMGELTPIHDHVLTLNVRTFASSKHWVLRRPQCSACGDENLHRNDRLPVPVSLHASPKTHTNSGGTRTVAPEVTLATYRHLVSPVSGVVSWLTRTSDESDPWLHVYWAGSNFGMRSQSLSSLRRSLRSKSAGKGSTREQSEASALCEAIERYSGSFQGSEIHLRKQYSEFADEEAIHPNDIQLFSDCQLDNAAHLNEKGHPYNIVPPRFDIEEKVDWTPVWSLTQQQHRYLPTSMLYSMPAEQRGPSDLIADSNGCAAGNSREEAILQGFLELAERDAFAIWWYNQLQAPAIDLDSFGDEYLSGASDYYARYERELWLLDVTADLAIPAFVAVSRQLNSQSENIIYGAGAHLDPRIAALRALCELNQCFTWLPRSSIQDGRPQIDDPTALHWWKTARIADCGWLAPAQGTSMRNALDYSFTQTEDLREDVEHCRSIVEAKGMEFLVLDQTRPDIGMPVVRVIVPGLRHFWARFAPGRLYDVPIEMGWRKQPLREVDLNPLPVIA